MESRINWVAAIADVTPPSESEIKQAHKSLNQELKRSETSKRNRWFKIMAATTVLAWIFGPGNLTRVTDESAITSAFIYVGVVALILGVESIFLDLYSSLAVKDLDNPTFSENMSSWIIFTSPAVIAFFLFPVPIHDKIGVVFIAISLVGGLFITVTSVSVLFLSKRAIFKDPYDNIKRIRADIQGLSVIDSYEKLAELRKQNEDGQVEAYLKALGNKDRDAVEGELNALSDYIKVEQERKKRQEAFK